MSMPSGSVEGIVRTALQEGFVTVPGLVDAYGLRRNSVHMALMRMEGRGEVIREPSSAKTDPSVTIRWIAAGAPRPEGWGMPRQAHGLGTTQKAVLSMLARGVDTLPGIAAESGMSRTSVKSCMHRLEKRGLVRRTGTRLGAKGGVVTVWEAVRWTRASCTCASATGAGRPSPAAGTTSWSIRGRAPSGASASHGRSAGSATAR